MTGVVDAIGSWMADLPFVALWLFFLCGGMARGIAVYGVGRGIAEGGRRSRFAERFTGPGMVRAEEFVARWGVIGIALCYLTVGFQSMVLAAAGVMRMPMWRFLPAALVGSIMWATIYTTVGFAAWETALGITAHSPWAFATVTALVVAGIVWWARRRAAGPRDGREHGHEIAEIE